MLNALGRAADVHAVATGDILCHSHTARALQDAVTAICEKTTIDAFGYSTTYPITRNFGLSLMHQCLPYSQVV